VICASLRRVELRLGRRMPRAELLWPVHYLAYAQRGRTVRDSAGEQSNISGSYVNTQIVYPLCPLVQISDTRFPVVAVLLAPYGLTGLLTGRAYSDSDLKTQKLLEDWRRYFYIPPPVDSTAEDGSHVPLFVEIIVGVLSLAF